MVISGWENFFEPHIRMRGETYFEHELVHGLKIGKEEISAVVEGTKPYNVRITLKNRTITGLFCTCPYADGGYACKHIAAVFCAVEKEPDPQPDSGADSGQGEGPEQDYRDLQREDTGASELVEAVRSLSEAKAKELLAEVAYRYPEFRTRLLAACGRMSGQDLRKAWERDLNGITREAAGRDGFIDWHSAGAYASRLCEYLDDNVCELIDGGELDAAFDLIELVFKEVLSVDIDDDGDIEFVAEDCCKYWKAIISHPESDQIDLFERIQRLAPESETEREDDWDDDDDWYDKDLAQNYVTDLLYDAFTDPECLKRVLNMIDTELQDCGEYRMEGLIDKRLDVMRRLGCSEREQDTLLKKYWYLPFVRKRKLDEYENEQRWDEALQLIEECRKRDAGRDYLLSDYEKRKIRILKAKYLASTDSKGGEADRENYIAALKKTVLETTQTNLSYILDLKAVLLPEQWPKMRDRLLQERSVSLVRRDLLKEEQLFETLMDEIEGDSEADAIVPYEKSLRGLYPQRTLLLMVRYYMSRMEHAGGRQEYAEIARGVKLLYGYENGKDMVRMMAAEWRDRYRRRSAMLEELKKAGL